MCEGRRRRPRGGGGPGAGAQGLRARRKAFEQQRCPVPRPLAPQLLADAASRPHSSSPALAGPNAPARPGKVEGGAALSASAPPLGPREFPAPPCGAAPRSGSRGDNTVQSGVPGAGPRWREGAWPRRGASDLGVGELTDRSANRRGRNARGAQKSPRCLREWHVPNASSPPSPTPKARRGLHARLPASRPGARLRSGPRTWAVEGSAPTHAHKPPPPPAGFWAAVLLCVSVCWGGGDDIQSEVFTVREG